MNYQYVQQYAYSSIRLCLNAERLGDVKATERLIRLQTLYPDQYKQALIDHFAELHYLANQNETGVE